jgi:ectoine hydroxylase-related dioxygenase (phytanoyl-CoA dioxygenase family)
MKTDLNKLRDEYATKGYCIARNIIKKEALEAAYQEIISSDRTSVYKDQSGQLRRIEGIYDKGPNLININNTFLEFLNLLFNEEFLIFKDKYNAKPPGGEGFFAHYDGIFTWVDKDGVERDGWHYYSDKFVNILVAIDAMTEKNGPLEIAIEHKGSFNDLLKNTKNNSTPDLRPEIEASLNFKKIFINPGDIVLFSSRCPHRSGRNSSLKDRRTIYYSYNPLSEGDHYLQYFKDKDASKNKTSKSLSGEI